MFNKLFNFLYGYVIIRITGAGAERFLSICIRRNLHVWDSKPCENGIELSMRAADFMCVPEIAKKSGVKIKILQKNGCKHNARRGRKRYMFLAGFAACVIFFAVSAQFIWLVEINGASEADTEAILASLDEIGVRRGALKRSLPEPIEMKNTILANTDDIAWAWVYVEGVKARVEIYEKVIPPELIDKKTPCDVVALCEGVIKSVTVKNGEPLIREGDAVSAGDILVSGNVHVNKEGEEERFMQTHSIAEVMAYTVHTKEGAYKLYYEPRTPTGREKKRYYLELFGRRISFPYGDIKYEDCDYSSRRGELNIPFFGYSGITLVRETYSEVSVSRESIALETALDFAKNDLEEKIAKELNIGAVMTGENLEYTRIDNETINVRLEMNFIQNIASEQPLEASNKGEEVFD